MPDQRKQARRKRDFALDESKFETQKVVTWVLLAIFALVAANVMYGAAQDQSERSTILQTVINFTMIAVGYWLGASKAPNGVAPIAPIAPLAPIAPIAPIAPVTTMQADDVTVKAAGDVTVKKDP